MENKKSIEFSHSFSLLLFEFCTFFLTFFCVQIEMTLLFVCDQVYNLPRGVTVLDFKTHIAGELDLKPEYLKLLHRGKILAPDESPLNKLGVRYGSKLTLMRTEQYHEDKATIDIIHSFSKEILAFEQEASKKEGLEPREAVILDEQLTGMLERIDGIDTAGRPTLRAVLSFIPFYFIHPSPFFYPSFK